MHINLCVFNNISPSTNDVKGIADHILFLKEFFGRIGLEYKVSELLDPNGLNILIENFSDSGVRYVQEFCEKHGKMICLVMTEHLNIKNGELHYGNYGASDTEYIGNIGNRIYSSLAISENVLGFLTLGELPRLESNGDIFFKENIYRVGYPKIDNPAFSDNEKKSQLVFTGYKTFYRDKVIEELKKKYSISYYDIVSSDKERDSNLKTGSVSLNIPQNSGWSWISPMRVIYSLKLGLPCVHVGAGDDTKFYEKVLSWVDMDKAISNPEETYIRQVEAFNSLVLEDKKIETLFDVWKIMEKQ